MAKRCSLCVMIAVTLLATVFSPVVEAQVMYGLEFLIYPHLWVVDSGTGNTVTDIGEVTVYGYTVAGSRGMATDPTDGTLYAILYVADVQFPAIEGHLLVSLNTNNAMGTSITMLTQGIRDLTFDASGQLYGVSGGPNNATLPDTLFAIDKATGDLTELTPVSTPGGNPRNHALAFVPHHPGVLYHRYGTTGFETIDIAAPHNRVEISTNDIGMLINVSLVWDSQASLFRTAENPGGGGVPYTWVSIDTTGQRTNTGFDLPEILNGLAFDQAGTVGNTIFADGFESGDESAWSTWLP